MVRIRHALVAIFFCTPSLHGALQAQGYVTPHKVIIGSGRRTFVSKHPSPSPQRRLPLIHSSKEDVASLDFDQTLLAAESLNVTLTDPSNFVQQRGDGITADGFSVPSWSNIVIIFGAIALLALSQWSPVIITTYSKLLVEHPLPTKSLTSGALCGVSDVIAQYRDSNRKEFNFRRWIRFAGKFYRLRVGFGIPEQIRY